MQISVADKGMGISSADLPHIFEPFYRGADAQARQIHGNGLGLSIVKGIVEAHGGSVSVQSVHGQGSTFAVHLPAYRGEPSPSVPGRRSRPHRRRLASTALNPLPSPNGRTRALSTSHPPPPARLLLVEDEPGLVMTLTDRLTAEGYESCRRPTEDRTRASLNGRSTSSSSM